MGDFFKELFEKMPSWFYHAIALVIIAGIGLFFWLSSHGLRNFTKSISTLMGKDERLELQKQAKDLKAESEENLKSAQQVSSALFHARTFILASNEISLTQNPEVKSQEATSLIQRMIDQLCSDIKTLAGDEHRVGIWITDGDHLTLSFASAGFPKQYKGNRKHEINDSIAGRCFLRNQTIKLDEVTNDVYWKSSPHSDTPRYKSLICVPLGEYGVLTADGMNAMSSYCSLIVETYAALIERVVIEHDEGYRHIEEFRKFFDFLSKQDDDPHIDNNANVV